MKKIISMGIASAVLALTAIAASADIVATTSDAVVNGKEITVAISTITDVDTYGVTLNVTGLETTKEKITANGDMGGGNVLDDGTIKITGLSSTGFKAGDVVATVVFTVTGETGSEVAVALGNAEGYDEAFQNLTATVVAEGETPVTPGEPTPTDPENPGTGVALAVVPAVLAGAAVVVAKKRK